MKDVIVPSGAFIHDGSNNATMIKCVGGGLASVEYYFVYQNYFGKFYADVVLNLITNEWAIGTMQPADFPSDYLFNGTFDEAVEFWHSLPDEIRNARYSPNIKYMYGNSQ